MGNWQQMFRRLFSFLADLNSVQKGTVVQRQVRKKAMKTAAKEVRKIK